MKSFILSIRLKRRHDSDDSDDEDHDFYSSFLADDENVDPFGSDIDSDNIQSEDDEADPLGFGEDTVDDLGSGRNFEDGDYGESDFDFEEEGPIENGGEFPDSSTDDESDFDDEDFTLYTSGDSDEDMENNVADQFKGKVFCYFP